MIRFFILSSAYAIAPIVAGHGVVPLAFALYTLIPIGVLWCAAKFTPENSAKRALFSLGGMVLMYGTWLATILRAVRANEPAEQATALESMLWLSAPFQIAFLVVLAIVILDLKLALSARGTSR